MLRISKIRRCILQDNKLQTTVLRFFEYLNNLLLQTSFNRIVGTIKQLFTTSWFAILTEVAKYTSMLDLLQSNIITLHIESITKTVLSLMYVSGIGGTIAEEVKPYILATLHNTQKMLYSYSETG